MYNLSANNTSTQAYNSAGKAWLFLPDGAEKPTSITANAHVNTDTHGSLPQQIVSKGGSAIRSTDVIRVDPWGDLQGSEAGSS